MSENVHTASRPICVTVQIFSHNLISTFRSVWLLTIASQVLRFSSSERWDHDGKPTILGDHDPETFAAYLSIVYTGDLAARNRIEPREAFSCFVDVYILADILQDRKTANTAIDHIIRISDDVDFTPPTPCIRRAHEGLLESSSLCGFLVDYLAHGIFSKALPIDGAEDLPHSYMMEVIREARSPMEQLSFYYSVDYLNVKASSRHKCQNHLHGEESPAC